MRASFARNKVGLIRRGWFGLALAGAVSCVCPVLAQAPAGPFERSAEPPADSQMEELATETVRPAPALINSPSRLAGDPLPYSRPSKPDLTTPLEQLPRGTLSKDLQTPPLLQGGFEPANTSLPPPSRLLAMDPLPALPDSPETDVISEDSNTPLGRPFPSESRPFPDQEGDAFAAGDAPQQSAEPVPAMPMVVRSTLLSDQELGEIGLLTQENGGYPSTVWRGSSASSILKAFAAISTRTRSVLIERAVAQLAATIADMPPVSQRRALDLLSARLGALSATGDLNAAIGLASRIPDDVVSDGLLREKSSIALLAGDWGTACLSARAGLDRFPNTYWTKVALACHAVDANSAAFDLLLELTPTSEQPDADTMALIESALSLAEKRAPVSKRQGRSGALVLSDQAVDPLILALSRFLGRPIQIEDGSDFLSASPLVHASLAMVGRGDLETRWRGVSGLAYHGRLSGRKLLDYALAAPVTTQADPLLGVRPSQVQLPLRSADAPTRVRQLLLVSQQARQSGLGQFWGGAIGEAMKAIDPEEVLWPASGPIAAHLAYAGAHEHIVKWYRSIRARAQPENLEAASSLLKVWPYAIFADADGKVPFTPRIASLWQRANGSANQSDREAFAYLAAALEAFGYTLSAAGETPDQPKETVLAATSRALSQALHKGARGDVLLHAFALLGDRATRNPELPQFVGALQALRKAGFDAEARQLTMEVLFHAGVSLD